MGLRAIDAVQRHSQYRHDSAENFTPYRIMCAIAWYAGDDGVTGVVGEPKKCPSVRTIAKRAAVHRNTLSIWIPKLVESGELAIEKYGAGRGAHIIYALLLPIDPEQAPSIGTFDYANGTTLQSDDVPLTSHSDNELAEIRALMAQQGELLAHLAELMAQINGTNGTTLQSDDVHDPYDPFDPEGETRARAKNIPHPSAPRPDNGVEEWKAAHPATHAWLDAGFSWPGYTIIGEIIDRVGETPNCEALNRAKVLWTMRGYNPDNLSGILDWYDALKVDINWTTGGRASPSANGRPSDTVWDTVMEQLRAGRWQLPRDGPETRALNKIGGWSVLRNATEREIGFIKQRYLDAYANLH